MSTTLGIKAPSPVAAPAVEAVEPIVMVAPIEPTRLGTAPLEPTPVAPTPVAATPVTATPFAPTPVAPTPVAPTPFAPTPFAPTPIPQTPTGFASSGAGVAYPQAAGLSPTVDDELRARAASPSDDDGASAAFTPSRADSTGAATDAMLAEARGTQPRKLIAIGAGGVALLIIAIVVLTRGGDDKPTTVAAKGPATTSTVTTPAKAPVVDTPDDPVAPTATGATVKSGTTGTTAPGTEPATEPTEPTESTESTDQVAATDATTTTPVDKRTTPRVARKIGGKQVVLEYDTPAKGQTPSSGAKEDGAAIARARASYAAGNKRLFAGDPDGAIRAYQQSLAIYPGYVAGYRGLGLAYAQKNDKPKALKALRTYVGTVPGAKDAALIKKRISSLQAR